MKRYLASFVVLLVSVCLLAGCTAGEAVPDASSTSVAQAPSASAESLLEPVSDPSFIAERAVSISAVAELTVEDGRLLAADGTHIQLRGVSSHGLSWFPEYVNPEVLAQMQQEWGCNVFRVAMYTEEYNGYCTGDDENRATLKARIDDAVMATEALGMYLIIDWHILSDGNPLTHLEEAVTFFGETAQKYADKQHILYEICNEPNGVSWDDVREYADTVIPIIREYSNAVVLVGTPTWSQDVHLAAQVPITRYSNIMYTLHFYAASHGAYLRDRMLDAAAQGLPIFVSEFGICDASGSGEIDEREANLWMGAMNAHGISYVMWNLSNKDESSAMLLPSCTKQSGFVESDLSPTGLWFVQSMGSADAVFTGPVSGGNSEVDLSCELLPGNTWEADGEVFQQYDLLIHNNGISSQDAWTVVLAFDGDVQLQDSWNGSFTTNHGVITITSAEHNGEVPANGSVADIGFILSSAADVSLIGCEVE